LANPLREAVLPGGNGGAKNFIVKIWRGMGQAAALGEVGTEALEGLVSARDIGSIAADQRDLGLGWD
jgi:hypothetical protein